MKIIKCANCGRLKIFDSVNVDEKKISRDCRRHKARAYQDRMNALLNTNEASFWIYDHEIRDFVEAA